MLRDMLLAVLILWCVVRALKNPWVGILGWTLLSIMNPHRYTWNLDNMPVAAAVGGATLIGLFLSRDRTTLPITRETVVLIMLMGWFCITLPASFYFEASIEQWKKVMKIDLMILVAMMVLHTRKHIMALAWVLTFSIGFYGTKGGIFTLMTGGGDRVWGPAGTYIEGNNELALALVIAIPLFRFVQATVTDRRIRWGLGAVMLLSAVAALGTHSRGALLAIAAMAFMLWWRGDSKFTFGIVLLAAAAGMLAFMPENWTERMESITDYQSDGSAMGRINAWWMAWNLASANVLGGGFEIYNADIFGRYAPIPDDIHAAHSIYFQILGEHGFVGLLLFVLLWTMVWLSAGRLRRDGHKRPETMWLHHLGAMCQVSLVGYAIGGMFLSLAYFDLPYNILVLVVTGRRWIEQESWRYEPIPGAESVTASSSTLQPRRIA
jgi:putative inorganic carbon (HCO3(-)) transporter